MGLARQLCDEEKVREYLWRGAEAYDRCGHLESAAEQLHELLEAELSKEQKLEALCFLADVQARARAQGQAASVDPGVLRALKVWGDRACKWPAQVLAAEAG